MIEHELIKHLEKFPKDAQVFIENETDEPVEVSGIYTQEKQKSNGEGTFDTILIY